MPLPERHDEGVTFFPLEIPFADPTASLAFENMINRRARVAMRPGGFLAFEELHLTRHGRISVTAGRGIDVVQQRAVVRVPLAFAHRFERAVGFFPRVAERNTA